MSSTPLRERSLTAESSEWVDIAPPTSTSTPTGANIMIAISKIRQAIAEGNDTSVVLDTETFRPVDEEDTVAAKHAADRWDD